MFFFYCLLLQTTTLGGPKRELKPPVSELGLPFSHGNSSWPVVRTTLMVLKGSPAVRLPSLLVVSVGECYSWYPNLWYVRGLSCLATFRANLHVGSSFSGFSGVGSHWEAGSLVTLLRLCLTSLQTCHFCHTSLHSESDFILGFLHDIWSNSWEIVGFLPFSCWPLSGIFNKMNLSFRVVPWIWFGPLISWRC